MNPLAVISSLALLLSVISLGWQIWSWRSSGHVVEVTARQSLPVYDVGTGDWQVDVTARNKGRASVQVTGWALETPNGQNIIVKRPAGWSTPLPHTLEAGTAASWYVPTDEIQRACAEVGVRHQDVRAHVRLGTGATVKARERGVGLK